MKNIDAATTLIEMVCEHQVSCNDHTRRLLLTGISEFAQCCVRSIQSDKNREKYGRAESELELIRDTGAQGKASNDLAGLFREILTAADKASTGLP